MAHAAVTANNALQGHAAAYRFPGEAGRENHGATAPTDREPLPPLNLNPIPKQPNLMPRDGDDGSPGRLVARASALAQKMDKEAIAGTAVGVVLAVALLVFCLYPVIVGHINRRRKARGLYDPEGYGLRGEPPILLRRLSSSDLKQKDDSAGKGGDAGKDHDPDNAHSLPHQGQPPPNQAYDGTSSDQIQPALPHDYHLYTAPPYYGNGDHSQPGWPNHIILKGNNEDYYSPYVPSEAFGMYPEPPQPSQPERAVPRNNSVRYNVKQLFRRKGGQDQTAGPKDPGSDVPFLQGDMSQQCNDGTTNMPAQQHHDEQTQQQNQHQQEQHSQASHYASAPVPGGMPVYVNAYPQPGMARVPVWQHPHQQQYQAAGSSIPGQMTAGTVNPMEIMPASTESEMWHRADYQMFSYDDLPEGIEFGEQSSTPGVTYVPYPVPYMTYPPQPPPHMAHFHIPPNAHGIPTQQTATDGLMDEDKGKMPIMHPSLVPMALPNGQQQYMAAGHPSHPLPPPPTAPSNNTSTEMSSQTTPSTQGDTPSPNSAGTSDCHNGASPHYGPSLPSPKNGIYRCDVVGCNQVFDQPHKLKHHQRYHSKDHKCPYPTCGKGFGTKTHLQRHINDRHEKKKKFHCAIQGCDYSRAGGKAFPRKDNWKRHMTKIHGMDPRNLPEPVEVEHDMSDV